jgi:hypothetical protein
MEWQEAVDTAIPRARLQHPLNIPDYPIDLKSHPMASKALAAAVENIRVQCVSPYEIAYPLPIKAPKAAMQSSDRHLQCGSHEGSPCCSGVSNSLACLLVRSIGI